ncbi:MAG TPA: tetratricopeptide repeat protein, partial [Myxococcaceae bacterium]|nr:tetratricopeptide repeat protein [Myxococcaceae bacterium]
MTKTATVPGPPTEARLSCLTCGAELEDPFDRALGVCESCRRREVAPKEADAPPDVEPTIAATPAPAPTPASRHNGAGPKPPSGRYPIAPSRITATRPDARLSPLSRVLALPRLPLVAGGAGVAVLAALATVLFVKPGVLRRREEAPRGLPPAVQAALPAWRMSFVEVAGNAPDYLTEGDGRLAADLPDAYAEAAEAFQKALILDPRSDAAIAGYVLAIALGQGSTLNDAAFKEASDLVEAAEHRSHRAARPLVAEAHLLLARPSVPGNVDRARALADEAAHAAQGASLRAEALLASGRSFVGTSAEMAGQQLDQALALAPNLKRAYLYRAMSHAAAGRYQEAIADFRKRIALDPEQWEALAGLSTLYAEVGDGEQARRVWEGVARDHPDDIRGKLPLAVLSYQLDGKPAAAVSALEALVRARSRYDDRQLGEVLVHLAAAQRAEGDVEAADASAQEALKIRADDPAAHLQAFLLELDRGAAPAAAKHWPFLVGRLDDSALEKVLEGRLRMAEGRFPDAAEAFEKSYGQDPRRLDAAILGGVAAAMASARTEAFKDLFAAAHLDPTRSEPRPAVTRFYLQPGESLRGTEGYLVKLASGGDETVAKLDEALILYHHHQLDRADKLLNEVLALDDNNALAHAL